MYMITEGIGKKWKPLAVFFSVVGLIGTLCIMQANQLTETIVTIFTKPAGIPDSLLVKFIIGCIICAIVAAVILGGIKRIANISSKIVPLMVGLYFLIVAYIILTNLPAVPKVFGDIFRGAFMGSKPAPSFSDQAGSYFFTSPKTRYSSICFSMFFRFSMLFPSME